MRKELHPDFIAHWEKYDNIVMDHRDYSDYYYCEFGVRGQEVIAQIFDNEKYNYYYCTLDTNEALSNEELILRKIKLLAFL